MTPHEQMRAMDLEGTAYEVTMIRFVGDDKPITGSFGVMEHTEEWIELCDGDVYTWAHMTNIAMIRIERL